MSVERGTQGPIDLTRFNLPDHGRSKTDDPLEIVKRRHDDTHPSDEVRNAYERRTQRNYYSDKPLDSSDHNYQSEERVTFEKKLPSTLTKFVNLLALEIHAIENTYSQHQEYSPNPYQKIVSVIRGALSPVIFYGRPLDVRIHCHASVKNLCDEISTQFKTATLDEKRWILFWIEDELNKR
jgi:hypothetical protein